MRVLDWLRSKPRRPERPVPTFPIEFKECPTCGCQETVARLACAGVPFIPEGVFVSLQKAFVPIQDVQKITTPMAKGVVSHYDVCARCGTSYCTRAEIISAPVTVQHRSGATTRGFGQAR